MTTDEMIQQAIKELQGQVAIGDVVAHQSHRLAHHLVEIEDGRVGVCQLPNGGINRFLISELFDANKVKARAIEIRLMESTALIHGRVEDLERMATHAKEN